MDDRGDWQDVLRAQQEELRRLELMNEALDAGNGQLDADINRALRKTSVKLTSTRPSSGKTRGASAGAAMASSTPRSRQPVGGDEEVPDIPSLNVSEDPTAAHPAPPTSPEIDPKAPDTAAKFQKARIKVLEKQVEDGKQLRAQLLEQMHDTQKQLQTEREENKKLKKRVQLLEVDQRRTARTSDVPAIGSAGGPSVADLQAEITNLKKDLQTAERLAKQSEANNKNKDIQIKRSTEVISRLKAENEQLVAQAQSGSHGDKARLDEMTTRVRNLEKQRAELIDAFRKQMKLIDVLKRQKSHIEAARLLNFSEEEFLKTLDWAL